MSDPAWLSLRNWIGVEIVRFKNGEELATRWMALQAERDSLKAALESFVRQVDEFEHGKWDELDWPAALAGLKGLRETARAALLTPKEAPEEGTK